MSPRPSSGKLLAGNRWTPPRVKSHPGIKPAIHQIANGLSLDGHAVPARAGPPPVKTAGGSSKSLVSFLVVAHSCGIP